MLDDLKQEANTTRTENGAAAYTTTMSDCLDLFSTIGALRAAPAAENARAGSPAPLRKTPIWP